MGLCIYFYLTILYLMWQLFQEVSPKLLVWTIFLLCGCMVPCASIYKNTYTDNLSSSTNTQQLYTIMYYSFL